MIKILFVCSMARLRSKTAALSTQCPIVVQQLPRHIVRKGLYPIWVEYPKYYPYS